MWLLRVGSHVGGTLSSPRGESGSLARNCANVAVSRRIDCFLRFFFLVFWGWGRSAWPT